MSFNRDGLKVIVFLQAAVLDATIADHGEFLIERFSPLGGSTLAADRHLGV